MKLYYTGDEGCASLPFDANAGNDFPPGGFEAVRQRSDPERCK